MHFTQHEQFWLLPKGFSFTLELVIWDTSIQGTPPFRGHKIWSRKNVHVILVFVTSILKRHTSIQGKGAISLGSELGHLLALKRWLTTKLLKSLSLHQTQWPQLSTRTQHRRGKLIMIFIHYLAAWDNDNNQLSRRSHAKHILFVSIQGTLALVPRISHDWRFHCNYC